jgi:hypothetical protein
VDLVQCTGAFHAHIFADDLNVLIRAPIEKKLELMLQFFEKEDTKVCSRLFEYAHRWKQPIDMPNLPIKYSFYSQISLRPLTVTMSNIPLEYVHEFRYLANTWATKLSMRKSVTDCLNKVKRSYTKLKLLKPSRLITTDVLIQRFFAYSLPFFAWLFCLFPFLPDTQQLLIGLYFSERVNSCSVHFQMR